MVFSGELTPEERAYYEARAHKLLLEKSPFRRRDEGEEGQEKPKTPR